ncbi:MAG: hypothetical protein K5753_04665 [Clostridia bacterium]|nr:hypothetical protein [Clostridia bacterium]
MKKIWIYKFVISVRQFAKRESTLFRKAFYIGIALIIFGLCFFYSCGDFKRKDGSVVLYDNYGDFVKDEIKNSYHTTGCESDVDGLPAEYTWTISTKSDFEELMLNDCTLTCDFEHKYYVLYTCTTVYGNDSYYVTSVNKANDELYINVYRRGTVKGEPRGTATSPNQRWFLFEIDKPIAKELKITIG